MKISSLLAIAESKELGAKASSGYLSEALTELESLRGTVHPHMVDSVEAAIAAAEAHLYHVKPIAFTDVLQAEALETEMIIEKDAEI